MKKTIISLFAVFLCLISLCGCQSLKFRPASLGESMTISGDGLLSADILQELKQKNQVVRLCGNSNGIDYEWTIYGSEIKEEEDIFFGIEIEKKNSSEILFHFLSKKDFGFTPALSFHLKDNFDGNQAALYKIIGDKESRAGDVIRTVKNGDILNFTPPSQTGKFLIRAEKIEKKTEIKGREESQNQTETTKTETTGQEENTRPISSNRESKVETKSETTSTTQVTAVPSETAPETNAPQTEEPSQTVAETTEKRHICNLSIECISVLNHLDDLDEDKLDILPKDGILFPAQEVEFFEGETVYDLLARVCKSKGIPLEASFTPLYQSTYVEGIGNLYEFDCGSGSGWMYCVDGWYPNFGCSLYELKDNQTVQWRYTCNLGDDIGGANALFE